MTAYLVTPSAEPPRDCPLCPRLVDFRHRMKHEHPDWFNAPVPTFGDQAAWLAIVGLAPGMHGANRTGRPFTGDFAGILLYETLIAFGLAHGQYDARSDDGLTLDGVTIVNAVRCLPPQNKPLPVEIRTCQGFLEGALGGLANLSVIVALGQIAHQSTVRAFGKRQSEYRFAHRAMHRLEPDVVLIDSYHCSRYNQNTRVLTPAMFAGVFTDAIEWRGRDRAVGPGATG